MKNKEKDYQGNTQNKNNINVNNNISFSINLGDSLNLLTLIAGLFIIKTLSKHYKIKKKLQKRA
ncbi:hypothetical protein ACFFF5_11050 [Lederbergia wuyishanensis]|uniref:Uncharacterized protein n=1 Tax=Lederbergia wuyishanensis TaxID=1347903 RepID=A0ABU0D4D5_9BACI|nr:hypothetical protein [Lederbergia wuyishanensis]MCJ8008165.1 hypothetical protein [Lederbergia wuyishanensis]MDQ0343246.1 hypothetical protein [Lederbergia wuyishanensis]